MITIRLHFPCPVPDIQLQRPAQSRPACHRQSKTTLPFAHESATTPPPTPRLSGSQATSYSSDPLRSTGTSNQSIMQAPSETDTVNSCTAGGPTILTLLHLDITTVPPVRPSARRALLPVAPALLRHRPRTHTVLCVAQQNSPCKVAGRPLPDTSPPRGAR
jgi:hypothetical protein